MAVFWHSGCIRVVYGVLRVSDKGRQLGRLWGLCPSLARTRKSPAAAFLGYPLAGEPASGKVRSRSIGRFSTTSNCTDSSKAMVGGFKHASISAAVPFASAAAHAGGISFSWKNAPTHRTQELPLP